MILSSRLTWATQVKDNLGYIASSRPVQATTAPRSQVRTSQCSWITYQPVSLAPGCF